MAMWIPQLHTPMLVEQAASLHSAGSINSVYAGCSIDPIHAAKRSMVWFTRLLLSNKKYKTGAWKRVPVQYLGMYVWYHPVECIMCTSPVKTSSWRLWGKFVLWQGWCKRAIHTWFVTTPHGRRELHLTGRQESTGLSLKVVKSCELHCICLVDLNVVWQIKIWSSVNMCTCRSTYLWLFQS